MLAQCYRPIIAIFILLVSFVACKPTAPGDSKAELELLREQVDKTTPAVASLIGLDHAEPVGATLLSRKELQPYFKELLSSDYPADELERRSQCYSAVGLLPRGYDMTVGLLNLLSEQAGGMYDPRTKTMIGISGLTSERTRTINDQMILSHELTHALQDQVIDFKTQSELALANIDYEYAVRALIEGMASAVMLAYSGNTSPLKLPDLQSFWRSQISKGSGIALKSAPFYLTEYLFSPYAEGGRFIQSWLHAHPGESLYQLLLHIPASSEQILHFEKYNQSDVPTPIDLSETRKNIPPGWNHIYDNVIGEFDFWTLFRAFASTAANASELAAGWDGCRFEAYCTTNDSLLLLGTSVWDTEKDAAEFRDGFMGVLEETRPHKDFHIRQHDNRVAFVLGPVDETTWQTLLKTLSQ